MSSGKGKAENMKHITGVRTLTDGCIILKDWEYAWGGMVNIRICVYL